MADHARYPSFDYEESRFRRIWEVESHRGEYDAKSAVELVDEIAFVGLALTEQELKKVF